MLMTPEQIQEAAVRIDRRLAESHARVYPTCTRYSSEYVAVDHGKRHGEWHWNGCPDHGLGTKDGMASDKMVEQARVALRA